MEQQPHVIIVNPDEWRGDVLGHLGNPGALTPNLDEWIRDDAVSFRSAFCQSTVCTPSRSSFMSGWYPHVRGHRTMHHMMRVGEPVLLQTLKDHGYFVWWGGKNDLIAPGNGFGTYCDVRVDGAGASRAMFAMDREESWRGERDSDTYYSFYVGRLDSPPGEPYYDADWCNVLAAIDQIKAWGERARANPGEPIQPLCVYLALRYPHPPYAVEDPWYSMVEADVLPGRVPAPPSAEALLGKPSILQGIRDRQMMKTWTEERWTALRATYYGMCARVDHQLGLVLAALRDAGIYQDSAVFFFSDHGDFTGDYGLVEKTQNTFEDCLIRVPLLVKPPTRTLAQPGIRDTLVELLDFPATVEELTGVTLAHSHFGRSLVPILTNDANTHRDAVFCEGGRLLGERHAMELESRAGQVPTGLYWPRLSLQAGSGYEHTKATMCRTNRFKYVRRFYELDELYDLRDDPHEQRNVINEEGYSEIRADMVERMVTWYQETCDFVPIVPDERE